MRIILGSKSASRQELLHRIVDHFDILTADIDEKAIRSEDLEQLPLLLAHAKADAIAPLIDDDAILITSDQIVVCNGELREKPQDVSEARRYLESYSIYPAQTNTAVVVTHFTSGQRCAGIDISRVYYKPIPAEVIERLIDKGVVLHTAGGFMVEDPLLSPYIDHIDGAIESIMGLPLKLTRTLIDEVIANLIR